MISLTDRAEGKVKEFIQSQEGSFAGVRVAVVAGGCSGFEYKLILEQEAKKGDQVLEQDGFRIYVDEQSMLYLGRHPDRLRGIVHRLRFFLQ